MRDDSPQWQEVGQPATPAEAAALLSLKAMLGDSPLVWAWSNISFMSVNGKLAETDVLVLTKAGLTLIELKGWSGRIRGNQRTWNLDWADKPNPIYLTSDKSKWLRELLIYVSRGPNAINIPFIRPITVLHGKDAKVELDAVASQWTYGLDGYNVKGVPPLSQYLAQGPSDIHNLVDKPRAQALVTVIKNAGFTAPPRVRRIGQYEIDRAEAGEQGPTWSDVIAENPHMPGLRKRIRLFNVPRGASAEQRQQVFRSAQREMLFTSGLRHPGVVAPEDIFDDATLGPALVFPYDPRAVRLDRWLADRGDELTIERRLDILRQLAEVLRYAHGRHVTHRALTPQQVYITESKQDGAVRVTIRDWQAGSDAGSGTRSTLGPAPTVLKGTRHVAEQADVDSWVYLAPEIHTADDPKGELLDVYGLGTLAYLLITQAPPAPTIAELQARLMQSKGLDPAVNLDGVPDGLRLLVMRATHPDAGMERTPSVAAFISDLDDAERELHQDAPPEPPADPLAATVDTILDNRFIVIDRLGSGSTGLALLVSDLDNESVLKIAHDAMKEPRLRAEYEVLARLDSPRIVKALCEPFYLVDRLTLQLENAGLPTLGTRIRDEGRLTLDQLERYGSDLLEAVSYLDAQGVLHRDIKPDNLGVRPAPVDRKPRLVLFDFSLANESAEHVKAGTPPYLDPFLGSASRPRYDRAAERFAIAVTLFEMATGTRPVWGTGEADPASISDEVNLAPNMFEASVANGMMTFFAKALARDAKRRFGDLPELAQAWAQLFAVADAATRVPEDEAAEATAVADVTLTTPLELAGLSARALSVCTRLQVATVGELLAVSPFNINSLAGIGENTRREIQRRIRELRALFAAPATPEEQAVLEPGALRSGVDALVLALQPRETQRNHAERRCARVLLGLDEAANARTDVEAWPSLSAIAGLLEVQPPRIHAIVEKLRKPWLTQVREIGLLDEIDDILASHEGIAEATEVARALLATKGSAVAEPARTRQAVGAVRVAIEADRQLGGDARFQARRVGNRMLIATEPDDPAAPPADTTLDWLKQVADVADRLAGQTPVPTRTTALIELRAVPVPEGVKNLTDERLLHVAAAASKRAAVGSRGEIYPRGLAAGEAIRLTLAGISAGRLQLTPESLQAKVKGRFPEAEALPIRPTLDRLVTAVDPSLAWNGTAYGATHTASRSLLNTEFAGTQVLEREQALPFDEVDARLRASLRGNGYLTLAVDPRRLDTAANTLAGAYGLKIVSITQLVLTAAKRLAEQQGIDWRFLLRVDAEELGNVNRTTLQQFVGSALSEALPPVLKEAQPLLFTDAAPLGRYHQEKWLADLADLATQRPAARWLLLPHRGAAAAPTLDAHVPVPLGADGYLTLTSDFLKARTQENAS